MISILNEISHEVIIEKSKFICHMKSVSTREEAENYIKKIREDYKDATHNVPCFLINDLKWCSDDGEPQGTSGKPILNLLESNNISNICVVVTRYFGGIKLGTGGLLRAYQGVTKECLSKATLVKDVEIIKYQYELDYPTYTKIEKLKDTNFKIKDQTFDDKVKAYFLVNKDSDFDLEKYIQNISNGKAKLLNIEKETIFEKI